jgi:subtilisin family serine protease
MKLFLLLFFHLICAMGIAQTMTKTSDELLIQIKNDAEITQTIAWIQQSTPSVSLVRTVSADWRIYLLRFDEPVAEAHEWLQAVRRMNGIQAAQWNYHLEERDAVPNDPDWLRQDNMTLIGAPKIWDLTTGGITPQGDTIVVAVLEQGSQTDHIDLVENAWRNHQEIPGDKIDNDGNSYVDDYRGWNPGLNSDEPNEPKRPHGTIVHGIIGARGDNNKGVTGVNWHVKLMNITGVVKVSEIIAGYEYVVKMRQIYRQSNKTKGAFVVATNSSFGRDLARPEDNPIWCSVYDSLGNAGILNIAATTNSNINVDERGDMPSLCPGEYLMIVNNVGKQGAKVNSTGTGPQSVDLGAPGEKIWSTLPTDVYGTNGLSSSGTSFSTPHVTGAVALIYSLPCITIARDALSAPTAAARRVRDLILQNTAPEPTLSGLTVTGGRLDLARVAQSVLTLCKGSSGPLNIVSIRPNPATDNITVFYETPDFDPYTFRVFDLLGRLLFEEILKPDPFGAKQHLFDATHLPAGVYVLSLGRNSKVKSAKFVKY